MKKIFNILVSTALLLGATSCTKLLDPSLRNGAQAIPDGVTVTVGFCVPTEIATKGAMADDPAIERIHVLVFDKDGILVQTAEAKLSKLVNKNYDADQSNTTEDIYYAAWKVELMMSSEKRILHFVANLSDNQVPTSGSEQSVFRALSVAKPQSSYWQRIELDDIQPYTYDGTSNYLYIDDEGALITASVPGDVSGGTYNDGEYDVTAGDYIDRNGKKIVNGTGYYYVPPTGSALREKIHLVRNFARIQFTNSWTGFTLDEIALVNYPKSGLVAPFDNSNGSFVDAYLKIRTQDLVYLENETYKNRVDGYSPILPEDGIETDFNNFTFTDVENNAATLYMYERPLPTADATCLLLGGHRNGGQKSSVWYKIELAKEDGSYFPVYRDFTYTMNLSSIDATATSYTSAAKAYENAPVGDISGSTETATLTQITDGNGLVLQVHEIDHPDLNGDKKVALLYSFVFEDKSTHTVLKDFYDKVSFSPKEIDGFNGGWATPAEDATTTREQVTSDSEYYSLIPSKGYPWYYVLVSLEKYKDAILKSKIRVTGTVETSDYSGITMPQGQTARKKSMYRDVTYTVMGPANLSLTTKSLSSNAIQPTPQTFTLTLGLPTTLADGVFPLTFKIEAQANNIAPVYTTVEKDKMPSEVGKSAFGSNRSTYYFLKTISLDDYTNSSDKKFDCQFQLTKVVGSTATGGTVTTISVLEKTTRDQSWFKTDNSTVLLKVATESTN